MAAVVEGAAIVQAGLFDEVVHVVHELGSTIPWCSLRSDVPVCPCKLGGFLDVGAVTVKVVQRPSLSQAGETLFCGSPASAGSAMSTLRATSAATFTSSRRDSPSLSSGLCPFCAESDVWFTVIRRARRKSFSAN